MCLTILWRLSDIGLWEQFETNKTIITGSSTETVLTEPAKTKPNLFVIVEDLQEWPVILLIDPLEYVVTHLFREFCGFNN